MTVDRVRALTGTNLAENSILDTLGRYRDAAGALTEHALLLAAADIADQEAAALSATVGVTAVEDIAVDRGKARQGWWDLAARLRARADDMLDDGPFVVPYHPSGVPEATESW